MQIYLEFKSFRQSQKGFHRVEQSDQLKNHFQTLEIFASRKLRFEQGLRNLQKIRKDLERPMFGSNLKQNFSFRNVDEPFQWDCRAKGPSYRQLIEEKLRRREEILTQVRQILGESVRDWQLKLGMADAIQVNFGDKIVNCNTAQALPVREKRPYYQFEGNRSDFDMSRIRTQKTHFGTPDGSEKLKNSLLKSGSTQKNSPFYKEESNTILTKRKNNFYNDSPDINTQFSKGLKRIQNDLAVNVFQSKKLKKSENLEIASEATKYVCVNCKKETHTKILEERKSDFKGKSENEQNQIFSSKMKDEREELLSRLDQALKTDLKKQPNIKEIAEMTYNECPLEGLILMVLISHPVQKSHLESLNPEQSKLFKMFLFRKKLISSLEIDLKELNPKRLLNLRGPKRTEEHLKLVIKGAVRYLNQIFKKSIGEEVLNLVSTETKSYSNRQDYAFYGFYFGETARVMDMPLERFFEPGASNRKKRNVSKNMKFVPKTISKVFIHSISKSKLFMSHFELFINNVILRESVTGMKAKVKALVEDWNEVLGDLGLTKGFRLIKSTFVDVRRCKLAWSLDDVRIAIKSVRKCFKEN